MSSKLQKCQNIFERFSGEMFQKIPTYRVILNKQILTDAIFKFTQTLQNEVKKPKIKNKKTSIKVIQN